MSEVVIRPIRPSDDAAMADIIRSVMTEFGAVGEGYSIEDPEVDSMSAAYSEPRHAFFVALCDGELVGGAGSAPLQGGEAHVCELRKMYLSEKARGLGLGKELLERSLDAARKAGFEVCYLETLDHMHQARKLYERFGFQPLDAPMGNTGHCGCDAWYALDLKASE